MATKDHLTTRLLPSIGDVVPTKLLVEISKHQIPSPSVLTTQNNI